MLQARADWPEVSDDKTGRFDPSAKASTPLWVYKTMVIGRLATS
jgi:hypothetical protein